ncbi:MAG: diacylglycerol kinase family lipid kinase [Nocardioides sp.]|nr:diacylglycerol kinase family lipid kinase [Nocardioides sp.]
MRTFCFLVNPSAGGGAAPAAVVPVARLLREAGASVDVTYSPGPQAMLALGGAAVGRGEVVVSVGGDGMLASLVGPVSEAGGTLGILPAGRGNDFARMLGVPETVEGRARLLLEGEVRRVDLLAADVAGRRRLVAGSMYAGVDAHAAALVHRMRRVPTALQYPLGALRALATYRPTRCSVEIDGSAESYDAAMVVMANSGYYGKGMKVAPAARLDDGLLDVIVVEAASRLELMRRLPTLYDGSHVALPQVHVSTGRRVRLSAEPAIEAGADGEPLGLVSADCSVEVVPGALAVIA